MATTDKEERFERVAAAVVRTLLREGPAELRVATVARRAKVSRAWVYKYFGRDTSALIDFTARRFGTQYAQLDEGRAAASCEEWLANLHGSLLQGLLDTEAKPWTIQLRFGYRYSSSPLGDAIRDLESRHLAKLQQELPPALAGHPSAPRFVAVYTQCMMGIFMWWSQPENREGVSRDAVVHQLLGMARQHIQLVTGRQAPPLPQG